MSDSANVASLDAVLQFAAAVVEFQAEARMCLTALDSQLRQVQQWLTDDRPSFWKREIEGSMRAVEDARIRLHKCRMRRLGDFRPTCFEEQKDLEHARQALEFAQSQIPRVKRWSIAAGHEANEFHGRAGQTVQFLEREIPRLLALLNHAVDRIERYAALTPPQRTAAVARMTQLADSLQTLLVDAGRIDTAEPHITSGTPPELSAPAPPGPAPPAPPHGSAAADEVPRPTPQTDPN